LHDTTADGREPAPPGMYNPLQVVGKTYLLGVAVLKPSTVVFMVFFLLEPPQKEIMGKMVFIFPMLDKVDVFVHESGGKVGKNTPSQLFPIPMGFCRFGF